VFNPAGLTHVAVGVKVGVGVAVNVFVGVGLFTAVDVCVGAGSNSITKLVLHTPVDCTYTFVA
jgi:hypothetical protein